MSKKRMTRGNAARVLGRLARLIASDKDLGKAIIARINVALDECLAADIFGTEGQLDPRGDRRSDE
jgi:hypothetical protein